MNITIAFFVVFVVIAFLLTYLAGKRNVSASSHYVADKGISGWQNGLAIAGDFIFGASFLGLTGAVALAGYGGLYFIIGGPIAFVLALLILAEPMRNLGQHTMADVITSRFNTKPARSLAALNAVVISLVYMVVQFVGAGALVSLLLGIDFVLAVIIVVVLMTIFSTWGGMLATTWLQVMQMAMMGIGFVLLLLLTLAQFNFNPLAVLNEAVAMYGDEAVTPASMGLVEGLDTISLNIGLALGILGLPHIMIRLLTVPDVRAVRSSLITSTWAFILFYALLPIVGFGAAVLIGRETITQGDPGGNLTAPLLAEALGGNVFLAFIAAVAFIVIVATLAGINMAASGAFGHDLYTNVFRGGEASAREQHIAARSAGVLFAVIALIIALGASQFNLAFLANLAFAIAASANLPALVLTVFWRRFNITGAITGMSVGLTVSVLLVLISPNVMGENAIFPLTIPALVSVPLGFLSCYVGTILGRRAEDREQSVDKFEEVYVRANT